MRAGGGCAGKRCPVDPWMQLAACGEFLGEPLALNRRMREEGDSSTPNSETLRGIGGNRAALIESKLM